MRTTFPARRLLAGLASMIAVTLAGFLTANAIIPTWGATPEEQRASLPGDEAFPTPVLQWRHAATIAAAPEAVWPWLVQMGDTRAGYYSYRYIEKAATLAGGQQPDGYYRNTNTVHPEWQTPSIGQGMILDTLILRDYQPGRYLVAGPAAGESGGLLWTWAIAPGGAGKTRLQVHMAIQMPGMQKNRAVETLLNLMTFMMEKKMITGIQLRAEGGSEADWVQIAEAALWLAVLILGGMAARQYLRASDWRQPLAIGVASIGGLFIFTYVQPALWLRAGLAIALSGALAWQMRRSAALRNAGAYPSFSEK